MFCKSFPEKKSASVPFHTDLRQKNVKILLSKFWLCYLTGTGYRGKARIEITKEKG